MNDDDLGTSNDVTYFDNFWVNYIPKEINKSIGNKNIATNNLEYNHMIQEYAFDLLILCSKFVSV